MRLANSWIEINSGITTSREIFSFGSLEGRWPEMRWVRRRKAAIERWRSSLSVKDRKSTRLNSSHTVIYTLSLHDALPISRNFFLRLVGRPMAGDALGAAAEGRDRALALVAFGERSEEHTSELQSHRDLHSFPTRRSSDLAKFFPSARWKADGRRCVGCGGGRPRSSAGARRFR